jgi:lactoylglutathione lyase
VELRDVRLLVDRFDECVRFYTEVLGLKLKLQTEEGVYAEFESGQAVLALYKRELMDEVVGGDHVRDAPRTDRVALIFQVDDVDAAFGELLGRGTRFATKPHDQEAWGLRVAHLRDPDENLIELYHPLRSGGSAG